MDLGMRGKRKVAHQEQGEGGCSYFGQEKEMHSNHSQVPHMGFFHGALYHCTADESHVPGGPLLTPAWSQATELVIQSGLPINLTALQCPQRETASVDSWGSHHLPQHALLCLLTVQRVPC